MTVTSFAAAQLLRVLPRAKITRAVGQLCDVPLPESLSSAVVGLYVRAYGVDLHEAEARSKPYPSFDAFFTRPLREGMRPLAAEPRAIISPADGRVASAGPIDGDGRLMAKGQPYRVEDLVGDRADGAPTLASPASFVDEGYGYRAGEPSISDDGTYVAYAQWPDEATWKQAMESRMYHSDDEARRLYREAIVPETFETLFAGEVREDLLVLRRP